MSTNADDVKKTTPNPKPTSTPLNDQDAPNNSQIIAAPLDDDLGDKPEPDDNPDMQNITTAPQAKPKPEKKDPKDHWLSQEVGKGDDPYTAFAKELSNFVIVVKQELINPLYSKIGDAALDGVQKLGTAAVNGIADLGNKAVDGIKSTASDIKDALSKSNTEDPDGDIELSTLKPMDEDSIDDEFELDEEDLVSTTETPSVNADSEDLEKVASVSLNKG
ncbi:Uncharacterised protein [Legionella beliardensis]|uniref:Uncharacterized protein n=1 Tax=Legionella beliardensis TaxID=91822 RepID=A0A378HZ73_9GAMM|nr:hypothetical protein [Legionella beliardensis]STX27596.1 Uncharacterised protein [Legionella beliardensis]